MKSDSPIDKILQEKYPTDVSAPPPGKDLQDAISGIQPVATRKPWRKFALLAVSAFAYSIAIIAFVGVRPDVGTLPAVWVSSFIVAWVVAFGAIAALAMIPKNKSLFPRVRASVGAALIAIVLAIGSGLLFSKSAAKSHVVGNSLSDIAEHGSGCMQLGIISAIAPVLLALLFLRRALPTGSRGTALAIGASAGCIGGLVLHLHCHISSSTHLGLVHGGVVAVTALLTWLLAPRFLKT